MTTIDSTLVKRHALQMCDARITGLFTSERDCPNRGTVQDYDTGLLLCRYHLGDFVANSPSETFNFRKV